MLYLTLVYTWIYNNNLIHYVNWQQFFSCYIFLITSAMLTNSVFISIITTMYLWFFHQCPQFSSMWQLVFSTYCSHCSCISSPHALIGFHKTFSCNPHLCNNQVYLFYNQMRIIWILRNHTQYVCSAGLFFYEYIF